MEIPDLAHSQHGPSAIERGEMNTRLPKVPEIEDPIIRAVIRDYKKSGLVGKTLRLLILLNTFFVVTLMVLGVYWTLDPVINPPDVSSTSVLIPVFPEEVHAGDKLEYTMSLCRTSNAPVDYAVFLINEDEGVRLVVDSGSIPGVLPGCYEQVLVAVYAPERLPDPYYGKHYRLAIAARYAINPLTVLYYEWETEEFLLLPPE